MALAETQDDTILNVKGAMETAAHVTGGVLGAYHGYKRYRGSLVGTTLWTLFGTFVYPLAVPVMLIQGFGKEKEAD